MNKYTKLIVSNAAFAGGMVCLFSPGLIGLTPFSANAALAAAAIAVGIISVPSFVLMNKALLTEKKAELLKLNEEDAGDKAVSLMESYVSNRVLGGIARSASGQAERMEQQVSTFETLVCRRFGQGTISYGKFMAVIGNASKALESGIVRIANKMVIFDEKEYRKLCSREYKLDDIPDHIQEEKRKLYDENLDDMRLILEKNEKVLLEVDQLTLEMSELDYTEQDIEAAAEQIRELLGQLEYYSQGTQEEKDYENQ